MPVDPQEGERERAGERPVRCGRVGQVDQLVLEQALMDHGQAAGGHEPPGREGGQPELLLPPFGGQPPFDDREGALGPGGRRSLRQGEVDPKAVVARRVVEAGAHPDQGFVGPHLDGGGHADRVGPVPGMGGPVDPVGPGVGGGHVHRGPHRPGVPDGECHRVGGVDHRVVPRRRVVVGVPVVPAVHQPAVSRDAVDRERAVGRIDGDRDQPVGKGDSGVRRPLDADRVGERCRGEPGPAEPGDSRLAGEDPADRRLVDDESDLGVGACGEQRVELALDLLDRHAVAWLGADRQE